MKSCPASDLLRVLRGARDLLARGWTQGTSARSKSGRQVKIDSRAACCFCPYGAVARVAGLTDTRLTGSALKALRAPGGVVVAWNDTAGRTQAEVLKMFDAAIARLERACS